MLRALPVPRRNMAWVQTKPQPPNHPATHSHPTVLKNNFPLPQPSQGTYLVWP